MISIRSVALAVFLVFAAPAAASGQCRQGEFEPGFHLDLDWERAARSGGASEPRGSLFPASEPLTPPSPGGGEGNSGRLRRGSASDCVFAAAVDRPRLILASAAAPAVSTQSDPDPDAGGPGWLRPFTFFLSLGGIYDSNINHDEDPVRAYGGFLGGGIRFETDDFYAEYEIASHRYSHIETGWSRVSHRLETSYEHDLSKKLELELVGEAALKGASEDRDLGDEYVLKPRLNYDLSDSQRVRLYGAYRLRRYGDVDPLRDANNYYAGVQFRQRLGSGHLDAEYRWELNRSKGPRNQYNRQTYGLEYTTPLAGGLHQLVIEARYRPVQYWHRRIDNEEDEGLRRDVRWIGTVDAGFALSRHISIHPTYRYERRTSNDPEEEWDAHLGILSVRYTFGAARSVRPAVAARETPAGKGQDESEKDVPKIAEAPAASPQAQGNAAAPAPNAATVAPPDPITPWAERAESDRRRLEQEGGARYAIELAPACEAEALVQIWKHDDDGALWLLRDPAAGDTCFRVFWGRYPSQGVAERSLSVIPRDLRSSGSPPTVIVALGGMRATR